MSNYIKYRAILNKYDTKNLPDTIAVKGFVCDDKDTAKAHSMSMIKEIFDHRFISVICPGMRHDPSFYYLDTSDPNMMPIIWYCHPGSDDRIPVFNATFSIVECTFSNATNIIEYRSMRINKYKDKWYVSSKFNNQIIGIIDDCPSSLNDICAAADKNWEDVKIDCNESAVVLSDN